MDQTARRNKIKSWLSFNKSNQQKSSKTDSKASPGSQSRDWNSEVDVVDADNKGEGSESSKAFSAHTHPYTLVTQTVICRDVAEKSLSSRQSLLNAASVQQRQGSTGRYRSYSAKVVDTTSSLDRNKTGISRLGRPHSVSTTSPSHNLQHSKTLRQHSASDLDSSEKRRTVRWKDDLFECSSDSVFTEESTKSNDSLNRIQTSQISSPKSSFPPPPGRSTTINSTEKSTMKVPPCPRYSLDFFDDIQSTHKFSAAVGKQNEVATSAIKSLDTLNDQIFQYIVASQKLLPGDGSSVPSSTTETVHSSMVLIRRLLLDAQARFRKMVEDNKQLAAHIDKSILAASQEVSMLRTELASTSKKIKTISTQEMGKRTISTQTLPREATSENVDTYKEDIDALAKANEQLVEEYKHLLTDHDSLKSSYEQYKTENETLKTENARLENEVKTLKKEFEEVKQAKLDASTKDAKPSYGELKLELIQTRQELNRAKELLQGMKSDRKRLKGEKLDLLSQMKQLYSTLEEKETELRDFIRNYEQRVKESDEMIKQLAKEKESLEKEKWDIITKAKESSERAVLLKSQLDAKEQNMKDMETELKQTKEKLSNGNGSTTEAAADGNTDSKKIIDAEDDDDDMFGNVDDNGFSTMEESSVLNCTFTGDKDNGAQILSTSPVSLTDSTDASSFKWFTQSSDFEIPLESKPSKKKKTKSLGTLSRVFNRSKMRRSMIATNAEGMMSEENSSKLAVLNQDNYQEKLNTIEKMVGVHMREWRAHQVLAWLEITLAMPMYAQNCLTNVKSGKVLLGLSDNELSAALGVSNPMHRRKLRLAIEQHREPNDIKYIKASEMDPTWIAHRFLPDLGLPQYTLVFEEQLCDGHVLNTLTRRDLEKHFNVHRKFHQSSILHAVELLRRIEFNKEKLYLRRNQSEEKDVDLIVWTNERLVKWIRTIDLGEYSDSLIESGVHGALMVLEPTFNTDTLASILGIPPSKSYIKRHLATELENILKPARASLDSTETKTVPDEPVPIVSGKANNSTKNRKSSQDKGRRGSAETGSRRKSQEEGRALLAELLGRKYEATSD